MKAAGLSLNAATLAIVRSWLDQGLSLPVILEYIIPETAIAPQPSIRYAAAIANRLISSGALTLEAATRPKARPLRRAAVSEQSNIVQCNYAQREYTSPDPGQIPAWLRDMMTEDEKIAHGIPFT